MKLLLLLILSPLLVFSQFCDPNGNVVLYSNYDGGELVINVDEDIQDLKIGVVSYEAVRVVFTGDYVSNVTGIVVAGYGGENDPCNLDLTGNSIVNYPGGSLLMTTNAEATLTNSNGYPDIICAYSCDINTNQGGCNTVDQIEDYMLTQFSGGSIRSHTVQYGCWTSDQLVSEGGNCCLSVANDPIDIELTGENLTCFESCDGEISSVITGGDGSYSYEWTGSTETTSDLTDLCAGEYTLTVTDGTGAQASETIVVLEPVEINLDVSIAEPIVCNGGEATVQVNASEGVEPYFGDGVQQFPAGTHTITVEDDNGCSVSEEITIEEPDEIVITTVSTDAIEECVGSITLSISGGDSPYDVQWGQDADNQTGETASGLCAGLFCATVTDANGCEVEACETVNGHASVIVNGQNNIADLVIYPNPSGKIATLIVDASLGGNHKIEVFDNQGRLISSNVEVSSNSPNEYNIKVMKNGTYLVRVTNKTEVRSRKWVVAD